MPPEIVAYYTCEPETPRLTATAGGALELLRSQELLVRHLPPPPASVLDVGGGAGIYTCWLARLGYAAHLLDLVPIHVAQARDAAKRQPDHSPAGLVIGDARALPYPDACADAVLLLGPLYHLTERRDRLLALAEARRVLRPGGVVFAVGVSRFASLLDGLHNELLDDPDFALIVEQDLRDGQHRNPTARSPHSYWTTAFFHHPEELQAEVREAGFAITEVVAVEGPDFAVRDLARWWDDPARRERLLAAIRAVEHEPSLLGMSAHIMVIARKD